MVWVTTAAGTGLEMQGGSNPPEIKLKMHSCKGHRQILITAHPEALPDKPQGQGLCWLLVSSARVLGIQRHPRTHQNLPTPAQDPPSAISKARGLDLPVFPLGASSSWVFMEKIMIPEGENPCKTRTVVC